MERTVLQLTQDGWIVWTCVMGLWTIMQVLFSVARSVRDDQ